MHEEKTSLWLADDLALNFLNTSFIKDGELTDTLQDDAGVRRWLAEGDLPADAERPIKAGRLLKAARKLRETIRAAVENRKRKKDVDVATLNAFLVRRHQQVRLEKQPGRRLALVEFYGAADEMELLSPIAYAASLLLVTGDFNLIRQCEGSACVLWFKDVTKAHRRRWCSMATCGNRHKVELFRSRARTNSHSKR